MVDFGVEIESHTEISREDINLRVYPVVASFASYAMIYMDDIISPCSPPVTHRMNEDNTYTQNIELSIIAKRKQSIDIKFISNMLNAFGSLHGRSSDNMRRIFSVSARRLVAGYSEEDLIDQYCDFWEACEFATSQARLADGRRIKGQGPVPRIAYVLARRLALQKPRFEIACVQPLYSLRKNLVHDALENPGELRTNVSVLKRLAMECLRDLAGVAYSPDEEIEGIVRRFRS
jgi:hypothetical protein